MAMHGHLLKVVYLFHPHERCSRAEVGNLDVLLMIFVEVMQSEIFPPFLRQSEQQHIKIHAHKTALAGASCENNYNEGHTQCHPPNTRACGALLLRCW